MLPNGVRIEPAGRVHIRLRGDMPVAIAESPNGAKCYVVTAGYHDHGVTQIDLADERNERFVAATKCTGGIVSDRGAGMFGAAGDLGIRHLTPSSDRDQWSSVPVKLPDHAWIGGLALLSDGNLLASDTNHDQVMSINPSTGEILWVVPAGHKPHRIATSADGTAAVVANWGGSSVTVINPAAHTGTEVSVGVQPSDVLFGGAQTAFIANSGSSSVSVVQGGVVVATVATSLVPNDVIGASPNSLALSPDRSHLYVSNGGSNTVAVINVEDPKSPKVEGFIPTGWYPTAVFAPRDGKRLLVATAKGLSGGSNYPGRRSEQELTDDLRNHYDYLPNTLNGDVMVLDLPDASGLAKDTQTCRRNAEREMTASLLDRESKMTATFRKIKHVVYVIRENRTYDQVMGDRKGTNADAQLCMYGERVTPNGHKIAQTWRALDNLYCDGEVSQDGHQWCCASYCTDFTEKAWPSGYADRGQPDGDESVDGSPGGYLWDNCARHGLTYRSYGEFVDFKSDKNSPPQYTGASGLAEHYSAEWAKSDARDCDKVEIFIDDLRKGEQSGNWPNFMVMSLGEDHTAGRSPGEFTPFSKVASNDVGLGKLVEAVSHSKFWEETAIFVIEDDAQDGPDHVDGHRTVGFVISPYVKRGGADHTLYSTASMIRTMELMLGLPPMSEHDRHATSMVGLFSEAPDLTPFNHEEAKIDLAARNPKSGELAKLSSGLDFTVYDRADPAILNRILWADAKPGLPYPNQRRMSGF